MGNEDFIQQEAVYSALDKIVRKKQGELECENDTLKAFIIDMWNAEKDDRFNILWDAHDYITKENKKL